MSSNSKVQLAKHIGTDELYAVKILKKKDMAMRNQAIQVLAERDILSFARNPFVVQMYCTFHTSVSIALDFVFLACLYATLCSLPFCRETCIW